MFFIASTNHVFFTIDWISKTQSVEFMYTISPFCEIEIEVWVENELIGIFITSFMRQAWRYVVLYEYICAVIGGIWTHSLHPITLLHAVSCLQRNHGLQTIAHPIGLFLWFVSWIYDMVKFVTRYLLLTILLWAILCNIRLWNLDNPQHVGLQDILGKV